MRSPPVLTLGCFLLGACFEQAPATEIVVTVDTTLGVPCHVDRLVFEVSGGTEPVTHEVALEEDSLPGSLTLVPPEGADSVSVRVSGRRGDVEVVRAEHEIGVAERASQELRFLLDASCLPEEPCAAVAAGAFDGLPEPAERAPCGADGYRVQPAEYVIIPDACDIGLEPRGTVLSSADGQEVASPLSPAVPFSFSFYGRAVESLWIGDNGYLGLGEAPPEALVELVGDPRSLGTPGFDSPGILPFWDKLKTGSDGVCLAVAGNAPNRTLWITWRGACFLEGASEPCGPAEFGHLTFSVGLEETSNKIYVGYLRMTASGANQDRARASTAVIGITGGTRQCPADQCDDSGRCDDGKPCGYTEFSALRIRDPLPALEFVPL